MPVQETFSTRGNLHAVLIIKCIFIRKMSSFKWSFISVSESTWLCVTSPRNAFCSVDRITTCKVQFWGRVSVLFLKGQHGLRNSKTNSWKKKGKRKEKQTNKQVIPNRNFNCFGDVVGNAASESIDEQVVSILLESTMVFCWFYL